MGARPSRPVKTTKVLAVWFLNGINRRKQARERAHTHTHTHTYTVFLKKQTYHHNTDCSARICQHYKTSNNWMNALHCTCNQPPTFQKPQKTQNSAIGLMASWVCAKNSNFSIYLSISFHLHSSPSLTVVTVFFLMCTNTLSVCIRLHWLTS